jgi:hypothetical protein
MMATKQLSLGAFLKTLSEDNMKLGGLYTSDQGPWPREILHYDWRIRADRSKDTLYQP